MADKAKLAEVLQKLDAKNENHWTNDGSPRLETVKFLNGGEAVSRDEIDEHFKDFNKSNSGDYNWTGVTGDINPGQDAEGNDTGIHLESLPKVDGTDPRGDDKPAGKPDAGITDPDMPDQRPGQDAEGNLTGVRAPEGTPTPPELHNPTVTQPAAAPGTSGPAAAAELTESPRADGAGGAAQASQPGDNGATGGDGGASETEQSEMDESGDGSDEIQDLEEELEDAEEELDDLRRARDDLNKHIDDRNANADKLRGRLAQLRGNDQTNTIQAYLESRKKDMIQRGENRQALRDAGLTLKSIQQATGASPIDQAMARKRGRGGNRPTRV